MGIHIVSAQKQSAMNVMKRVISGGIARIFAMDFDPLFYALLGIDNTII